jgi:hypothetical protein
MARLSFEEFSSGLPVQRANQPSIQPQGPSFTDGVKQDFSEMGTSLQQTLDTSRQERQATRARVGSGEIGVGEGAFQTIGQGLLRGGEFLGKAAVGFAKMALPEPIEQRIKETLGKDLQKVTDPETAKAFVQRLENSEGGLLVSGDIDKALAEDIKEFTNKYETDPNFKANVQAGVGFGEAITSLITGPAKQALTPDLPMPPASGKIAVTSLDNGVQTLPIRTAQQATEETLSQFGKTTPQPEVSGAGAVISGITKQVGDFASRTIDEAKEVAAKEQRLASLPQPESQIRRVVSDERVIDLVNKLTPEERAVTNRLVEQAKLKQGDITPNTEHPKVIAGEELLKPVQFIIDTRKSVGARLGNLRTQLGTKKDVNTNSAFRNIHNYLKDNYKVQFDKQGNIIPGTGTIAKGDVPAVQDLYDELRRGTFMSQKDIDEFLQRSYKDYDLRQAREQTFSDEVSRIAERARTEMRELMPDQYNALATQYAELSKPLVDTTKLLGYKGDLDKLTSKDLKAGEVALRILGNATDRPQSVIDEIVKASSDYGYKSNVNLNNIITLTDQLEGLYDITMPRSFRGEVTRGIEGSNAIGAMGDAATMNVGGLYNRAMQSRASQQEIRNAFEAYLKSLN